MNDPIRHAIILAAGRGVRMGAETVAIPKALLDLGGQSFIQHQVASLHRAGIEDITVVTGYGEDVLRRHLASESIRFVVNDVYETTNSLYSLSLAREVLLGGSLVLNSDVLFHFDLLKRLLDDPSPDAILVDFDRTLGDEEMKVRVEDGIVAEISKTIPALPGMGENVGIIKISKAAAPHFLARADELFASGKRNAWAPHCIHLLVGQVPFRAIPVAGTPWTEADSPDDLAHAREVIFPMCRA